MKTHKDCLQCLVFNTGFVVMLRNGLAMVLKTVFYARISLTILRLCGKDCLFRFEQLVAIAQQRKFELSRLFIYLSGTADDGAIFGMVYSCASLSTGLQVHLLEISNPLNIRVFFAYGGKEVNRGVALNMLFL